MKSKHLLLIGAVFGSLFAAVNPALAQGTAFTYQGRFGTNGALANGEVEFQFTLWNALSGGTQVAAAAPATTIVDVTNGLFTVPIDFGVAAFDGSDRYLQIEARTTIGPFTLITPRQRITATPYALLAGRLSGTLASNGLAGTYGNAVTFGNFANVFNGTFTGNGAGLSNLNAASLGGLSASNFWKLTGNAGTTAGTHFLGTTDNQPLELEVNGQRALRLEPIVTVTNVLPGGSIVWSNAPNVIGGNSLNGVDVGAAGAVIGGGGVGGYYSNPGTGYAFFGPLSNHVSAALGTIGGGGQNIIERDSLLATIGGGFYNIIKTNSQATTIGGGNANVIQPNSIYATISGGSGNTNSGYYTTIGGGSGNTSSGQNATVGGGDANIASVSWSTVGGGQRNTSSNAYTTVGGGTLNIAGGFAATVPGGYSNTAAGTYSFAAGQRAKANHQGAFVWADSTGSDFSSAVNNQFLVRASGGVGIGTPQTPPGGLRVHTGGLAVTGASSPSYGTNGGVYIEYGSPNGQIFAFDYGPFIPRSLVLNSPGGNVGVGRTPAANALEVEGNASKTTASAWLANSDARIKTDVHTVTYALEKLEQVRPVEFRYTAEYRAQHPSIEDRPYLNVIAQEFRKAFPEAVKSGGDKLSNGEPILQVDTYPLTIYSAAAIQELHQVVKKKDAEVEELKQRLEKLERLINQKDGGEK